mmetsp:Transcript_11800/g.14325  ORF Transcript_11800/g.14325 Transcript_11800/m.14325 type:complete len:97 (-) Transcript_11800:1048-1338(-)
MDRKFQEFCAVACIVVSQFVLAVYVTGPAIGKVVDPGSEIVSLVFYSNKQSYILPNAIITKRMAGNELTLNLSKVLSERGFIIQQQYRKEMVQGVM